MAAVNDPAFWNKIADKYAAQPVANPDAFDQKIEITRAHMTSDDVVLDIGCGTGSLVLRLASAGRHVHGLDLAAAMIRIADDKAVSEAVDNVTFHVGPFDESFREFAPGTLDGICAYSILHLVADRTTALAQIFELLKPGGFFISSTACLGEGWFPYAPLIGIMRLFGRAPSVVECFSKATLVEEMKRAGFTDISQPDVGADRQTAFIVARKPDRPTREEEMPSDQAFVAE